jgi:hypothetical protein
MAQSPREDLSLGAGLIRKGEARGQSPALADAPRPAAAVELPAPPVPSPSPPAEPALPPRFTPVAAEEVDDPPLRAAPPDDIPKRFTSFRLPVDLDEELRAMMFETRRSKQDLLIDFVTSGVQAWRRERIRRG